MKRVASRTANNQSHWFDDGSKFWNLYLWSTSHALGILGWLLDMVTGGMQLSNLSRRWAQELTRPTFSSLTTCRRPAEFRMVFVGLISSGVLLPSLSVLVRQVSPEVDSRLGLNLMMIYNSNFEINQIKNSKFVGGAFYLDWREKWEKSWLSDSVTFLQSNNVLSCAAQVRHGSLVPFFSCFPILIL